MTTIYLVRHGTTAWNQFRRYQGLTDNPLDEIGERQGALLADYFKDIEIDLGVTSPLRRAARTLEFCLASQKKKVPVIVDPCVIEMDFGTADGLTKEEIQIRYPEFYRMYILDEDRGHSVAPNGESLADAYARVSTGITRIALEHPGETIVVASHGTIIQTFLSYASGIPVEKVKRIQLYNVCVSCVEIDEEGKPSVRFISDIHHIPEELQFSYGPTPSGLDEGQKTEQHLREKEQIHEKLSGGN